MTWPRVIQNRAKDDGSSLLGLVLRITDIPADGYFLIDGHRVDTFRPEDSTLSALLTEDKPLNIEFKREA